MINQFLYEHCFNQKKMQMLPHIQISLQQGNELIKQAVDFFWQLSALFNDMYVLSIENDWYICVGLLNIQSLLKLMALSFPWKYLQNTLNSNIKSKNTN